MYWVRDGYFVTLANMPPFFQSIKPLNCVWHFEVQILSWLPDFGGSLFITWDPLLTSQLEQRDWDLKLLPSENEAATLCNTALQNQKDENCKTVLKAFHQFLRIEQSGNEVVLGGRTFQLSIKSSLFSNTLKTTAPPLPTNPNHQCNGQSLCVFWLYISQELEPDQSYFGIPLRC